MKKINFLKLIFTLGFLSSFFMANSSFAKRFTNEYTEFQLPEGWECALEGSEWVCQSLNPERKKEAIIILVAKKRGPQDTLANYESYLKGSKTYNLPGGKTQVSEPKIVTIKKIQEHDWVDALHLASEVPGYYTRYLATVKEDLGVAITFTVAKDHYDSYKEVFDLVTNGIKVFRQAQSKMAFGENGANADANGSVLDQIQVPDDAGMDINTGSSKKAKAGGEDSGSDMIMLVGGIVALAGVFVFLKKRKKK